MMRNRMVHWNEKVDHGVKIKMYSEIERREKKKKRETILQHLPFSSYPYQLYPTCMPAGTPGSASHRQIINGRPSAKTC